jgi:hypothetical protein
LGHWDNVPVAVCRLSVGNGRDPVNRCTLNIDTWDYSHAPLCSGIRKHCFLKEHHPRPSCTVARWCSELERKSSCCGVKESVDRVGQRVCNKVTPRLRASYRTRAAAGLFAASRRAPGARRGAEGNRARPYRVRGRLPRQRCHSRIWSNYLGVKKHTIFCGLCPRVAAFHCIAVHHGVINHSYHPTIRSSGLESVPQLLACGRVVGDVWLW